MQVKFNKPHLTGEEINHIQAALDGLTLSGGIDKNYVSQCQTYIESQLDCQRALLTTSCTAALEMAAILLDIKPGDEVIVPSFTFTSTVNAFVLRGAVPIFVDVSSSTLNIDSHAVEHAITKKTKAIVIVHYAGMPCDMDALSAISSRYNIPIVEDCAQSFLAKYGEQYTGTFGALAAFSFHETKNLTCGEGGALVINNPVLIDRANILLEKGTNRTQFIEGKIDQYGWVDIGSSYLMSNISAAMLFAQLQNIHEIQNKRQVIWHRYHDELCLFAMQHKVSLPVVLSGVKSAYHLFYMLFDSVEDKQRCQDFLADEGVDARSHFTPLHLSKMGRLLSTRQTHCPVTEIACERLLRLPLYPDLSEAEQSHVISSVTFSLSK